MRIILFAVLIMAASVVSAQNNLPTPRNIVQTYQKETRSVTGAPGKNYWQNRADYKLDIAYSPATRFLSGTAAITYFNNSPDTLSEIRFHLNMNYYKNTAPRNSSVAAEDLDEGIVIDQVTINDKIPAKNAVTITNTTMRVRTSMLTKGK
ncbi:MAG TPA: hypothetical protein VLJ68_04090, partial [Chitinophagaceae bacterium]|nr:hypothetical protein [Chitinophagaceae bacterium]